MDAFPLSLPLPAFGFPAREDAGRARPSQNAEEALTSGLDDFLHEKAVTKAKPTSERSAEGELEALVVRARAGEAAAQEALIEAYAKRLGGFVYGMVGDPSQVDDLCQTIFVKTVLSLHQLRDPARFEAWFFRLARNSCLSHLRRDKFRRLFSPLLPGHEEVAVAPAREESAELALLRAALRALPEKQRALLLLVQDRDQNYEELAAAAGIGAGAFKTRVHRAKLALKERIAHVRQRTLE